ncbi:mitochondrial peripheral inner membrane protein [Coccidioides posadasii str. Silveira]|uniref:Cytochrome c mitochondrial import factor CYC2 n=2 Tax=Coccidioides posadasii TaxID=199306 RepID=E9CSC0_COCPS|nr:oxidoreductase, FAD-binding family protein [Coccidioides posadasii C735 delta SOWgp]EER29014.1 oxidoreductase, FAD-binding family protein [Coccidioides posadasii C735 delta SOWgp]EFW22589.1 cytochrome c mitochondrial import factor CYC2 [Coccidioides posadasii str. Silveira]QVM06044.1 mitochondrial peripheral inner membrane protein [Coccidioides posadasii str. Silveira]|eukprot:XP_003071159.1 oxidoreductase, FAD-binding family protein [Coccidioides posadasii C735 delta SOWgp]
MVAKFPAVWGLESTIRALAWKTCRNPRSVQFRENATSSNTSNSLPKRRRWLQITILTVAAGGIGAYLQYREKNSSSTLNPFTFTKYELISKAPISSTCSVFTLRPVKQAQNYEVYLEAWRKGLWSVQFKQPHLQVGRDYTPLPPIGEDELPIDEAVRDGDNLRFLIRREPEGEVSGYLHSLKPGAILEFRGPQMEFELPDDIREVLFIAGGTGIAPALQAAHTIFGERQLKDVRMRILWANRRREDCLGGRNDFPAAAPTSWWSRIFSGATSRRDDPELANEPKVFTVSQLEKLKLQSRGRLSVDYFVDEENTLIGKETILHFTGQMDKYETDNRRKTKLILISGPDGFISYLAGPKLWRNGVEIQGPLQGLLEQLNLKGWTVWKL